MWTIILINEQCPFLGSVKKTENKYFPCSHDVNQYRFCAKNYCPIEENEMNESRKQNESLQEKRW